MRRDHSVLCKTMQLKGFFERYFDIYLAFM